jgi:excisionase family DNA binding protein
MMGSASTSLEEALRAAIRAELNALFEERIRPLLEARQPDATQVRAGVPMYASTADAAKMVGVSPGTVQAWVREHRLRGHKAGRLLRIKIQDLQAFMTQATRRRLRSCSR